MCVFIAWFNTPLIMHRVRSVWKHTSSTFNSLSLSPSCALEALTVGQTGHFLKSQIQPLRKGMKMKACHQVMRFKGVAFADRREL